MVEVARRRHEPRDQSGATDSAIYSSKIIKAGALLADTKTLLAYWNAGASAQANIDRLRRQNVFGKVSRSRVEDVLAIFRQRYLGEDSVTKALIVLGQKRLPAATFDRILYFHAAQADRLLHDTVTEILLPLQARGITQIDRVQSVQPLVSARSLEAYFRRAGGKIAPRDPGVNASDELEALMTVQRSPRLAMTLKARIWLSVPYNILVGSIQGTEASLQIPFGSKLMACLAIPRNPFST
jgi:bacteriophage exclusion system BrxA-like protein